MMVRAYPWVVVGMFWCVYFLNQADRQVIFSVFPLLKQEMHLSNTQLGLLGSSFQWVYAILAPIAGSVGDVSNRKSLIIAAVITWSIATFSSGLAGSFAALVALRALTGAGEAFYYPCANSMIGDYHGGRTRAFAMSLHQTSVYAGIVISGTLAGYVGQHYGWRQAFFWFGGAGILAALALSKGLREPDRGQSERTTRVASIALALGDRLREIFGRPTPIGLMLAFVGMNFVNVAVLTWMPTLLYQKFHLSLAEAGFHATFYHNLGAFTGVLIGGRLADWLIYRSPLSRPVVQLTGLVLGAPFIFLLGRSDSSSLIFASLGLFGVFRGLYDSNLFASLYEVVRPEARATATGAMLALGFLGGGSAALAVGKLSESIGLSSAVAWTSVCYLLSAAVIGITCWRWFGNDARRMQASLGVTVCV